MNTPISWIKAYVPDLDVTPQEFVDKITLSGSHVENYNQYDKNLEKIVVGKVLSIDKHPDADKLVICQVDVGAAEPIQIVTGAPNVVVGALVPTVLDGGKVAGGHDGGELPPDGIRIKAGKLRGVPSAGMMCAIEELGSSRDLYPEAPEDGIYIFPAGADVKPGDDAVKALGLDDTNVEYEITSNRVDCFSIIGMAREAAATFDLDFKPPVIEVKEKSKEETKDYIDVDIQDTKLCKRYIARVVKNVKIGPSPKWMQDRLRSQGIRAINNIVDITNYVMEEMGQPMHAFDLSTIAGNKIIVRRAQDGDKFTTLDGIERDLDKDVLMICDGEKEVAIAGIMGGENSMVTDSMDTLLFEAACFDGTSIRLSERRLGLRTDSAGKFEKGLDPNLAEEAINRACQLVEEMGCGEVLKGSVDVYPEPVKPWTLPFEPDKMNALLGLNIPVDTQLHIYDRLGLTYNEEDQTLTIPTFRQDLLSRADLAEEIARIYGYDKIPSTLPTTNAGIGGISYNESINRIARSVSEDNGFSQAMFYSFESPRVFDKLLIPSDSSIRQAIKISNPLGEDFSIMRTLPLNGLLTSLSINFNRRNKNVRLYELGKVYIPKELPLKELPDEKERLALGMYGEGDFFTLKGVVEELLNKLNFGKDCEFVPTKEHPFLHPGRQANIQKGKLNVGYIGQLHPEAALNYDMKCEVYVAVINMDVAAMLAKFDIKYTGIARFPASTRDLALVCDKGVYVGDIEKIIRKNAGQYLESLELFDVYEGEQVGEGKKSVAFSLAFRSVDHTLKDDEVNPAIDKILSALSAEGIEIRA
ncbi:MAG: phenylalanine--tRNA ligase subunit beta [Eubacterium sp.]|nr:phenylalanine--tRNA ligase subunit beta [Eubacterium sp.]